MDANGIAILSILSIFIIAAMGGMWKLATTLAEVRTTVRTELRGNGGQSLKDKADLAADAATIAAMRTKDLHDYITQAVADGQRETAEYVRQLQTRTSEVEAALAAHGRAVMEKHGEHEARLRVLGHDMRGLQATNDVIIHAIDLINQDRLRKEQQWTDAMRAQGLTVPVPRGIEHELPHKSREAAQGDDDADSST